MDNFHHFNSMTGGSRLFGNEFIPAPYIPGKHPERVRRLSDIEMREGVKSEKAVNVRPADQQRYQGDQGPATTRTEEQSADKKADEQQQQKRKDEAKDGNKPPSHRREYGIGAGQEEKDDHNKVRNDEQTACKFSESRHG